MKHTTLHIPVKAFKSSNKTPASANPVPPQTLHSLPLLLTWISTDSPSEVHLARRRPWPPHPFCYPPRAHIICFGLLGDISLWRCTEKLFKLHKHNVAPAPTGCWWWMGTAHWKRESGILPGELVTERDRHYFTALTGEAAVVTDNAGQRRHEEVWAERDTRVEEVLR